MSWIFAYGSLIWRPDFAYVESRPALIKGWKRRFWQASPDHRGVPAAPGRVVTLVRDPGAYCEGVAFLPDPSVRTEIFGALDIREQNGYALVDLALEFEDGALGAGVTYIAGPDNPSFVGPASVPEMVTQIANSHGPSGSNREYLLRLADALTELGIDDDEVHGLRDALIARDRDGTTAGSYSGP